MAILNQLIRVQNILKKAGVIISGAMLIIMMLFIGLDVILRNLMSTSIPGSYEYVQKYLMPFLIFPSLAYVYSTGILPRVEIILEKISEKKNFYITLFMRLTEIFIFSLMFYFSLRYAIAGVMQQSSFTAGGNLVPLYPALFIAVFGLGLLTFEVILITIKSILDYQSSNQKVLDE